MGVTPYKSNPTIGKTTRKGTQKKRKPITLPHGLVGTKTTAQVTIAGKDIVF